MTSWRFLKTFRDDDTVGDLGILGVLQELIYYISQCYFVAAPGDKKNNTGGFVFQTEADHWVTVPGSGDANWEKAL